jgi:hypothetical protein
VNQIKEDPAVKGLLWLGTDKSLYFSPDDGDNWIHLKNNLPPVPIYGIEIQKNFRDLVLATYGRGIYILDDITPIREFSKSILEEEAHLFSLRKTYRFQPINGIKTESSFVNGQNPPDGADINYFLKEKSKDSVEVQIFNSKKELVNRIKASNRPGINRIWWDLRLQDYEMPKLRTKPRGKEWVKLDEKGERNMFIYDLDIGPGQTPPMVPDGNYIVVLKVNGKEYRKPLLILKDPNTKGSDEDIQLQFDFGVKLYTSTSATLKMIDEMERMRAALLVKKDKKSVQLEEKIYQLEGALHDVHQTGARMDIFRNPPQVLERLFAMAKEGQISSADAPPTDQQMESYRELSNRVTDIQNQWELIKKTAKTTGIEGK